MKQYSLKIFNADCNFVLEVNNIEVLSMSSADSISTYITINEYLLSEKNTSIVRIIPLVLDGKEAEDYYFEYSLCVDDFNSKTEPTVLLSGKIDKANLSNGIGFIPISIIPKIQESYLDKLQDISRVSTNEVYKFYSHLYLLFKEENLKDLLTLYGKKIERLSAIKQCTEDELTKTIKSSIDKTFADSNNELLSFKTEEFSPKFSHHGKLLTLIDKYDDSVIIYENQLNGFTTRFDFLLGKVKGEDHLSIII